MPAKIKCQAKNKNNTPEVQNKSRTMLGASRHERQII
jgi:hypothetical protein